MTRPTPSAPAHRVHRPSTLAPATTPIPAGVEDARRVLSAVLDAGPVLGQALLISEALEVLLDVHPPYPPLGCADDPTEPELGIRTALGHLDRAVADAVSVRDLSRYAAVTCLLTQALLADAP